MSLRGFDAQTGQWHGLAGTNCHDATTPQSGFTKSGLQGVCEKQNTFKILQLERINDLHRREGDYLTLQHRDYIRTGARSCLLFTILIQSHRVRDCSASEPEASTAEPFFISFIKCQDKKREATHDISMESLPSLRRYRHRILMVYTNLLVRSRNIKPGRISTTRPWIVRTRMQYT
ncbi:hypothetical protein V3481_009737 [Fusarium oxysporum f. sp. vasinfectum]|uniref:Uncharacterized protein n=1 Tax=Fusarium oxysporum f. sp. vasinfectum 25433 TaxID=1089449 RepID=X0LVJ0_FUSOX|nr:hypothetical protein FOTG_07748 [Fusarium oxysporum f. sp. vasinfectum 25433]KAJ0155005.1 Glutamyl-tRNA(Gln) amidotransferase subunit A [Fusarium oxysporum f. sp. albedinis]